AMLGLIRIDYAYTSKYAVQCACFLGCLEVARMGELDSSLHARALAGLGAAQGGRARAEALSPEERKHIARQAAEARWGNPVPKATHTGQLVIVGRELACAVLENSTRVFTQATLVNTIGGRARARGVSGLHLFLAADNLQPFISDEARR